MYIRVEKALNRQAAVALIGPRQVGKTTLALNIANTRPSIYLDLESTKDKAKLDDPRFFFQHHEDKLIILDEIHRVPEIFQELRGIIDDRRRKSKKVGHFLILGSASIDLLQQSGETLAGRIEYVELSPFNASEVLSEPEDLNKLWVRGGFPESFLAHSEEDSLSLREGFIRTSLSRYVPLFGPRIPAETLRRLWTMLAHNQGCLLNSSRFASSLSVTAPTVTKYVDLLSDLLLVRRLPPFFLNVGKRLVKSPKTYVRDSGLLHALLNIESLEDLMGHPIVGASWEGFVIENILSNISSRINASFYRTAAGAEIDLVLEMGGKKGLWAIEIKRGLTPKIERGFHNALEDLQPERAFVVYSGDESYSRSDNIRILSLKDMIHILRS